MAAPRSRWHLGGNARQGAEGCAWAGLVRDSLARVEPDAAAPSAGPGEADIAACERNVAEQRDTMIRGMVVRLADRLKQDGSDVGDGSA